MKKVLLVDDSLIVRNSIRSSLEKKYDVIEAGNGELGFKKALSESVDLFIFDVNMPIMDGITLTSKIREVDRYKSTPIIMLTTESKADKREKANVYGATGWIVKPCESKKLLSVIKMLVK